MRLDPPTGWCAYRTPAAEEVRVELALVVEPIWAEAQRLAECEVFRREALLYDMVDAIQIGRHQLASGLAAWPLNDRLTAAMWRARHEGEETRRLRAAGLSLEQRLRRVRHVER